MDASKQRLQKSRVTYGPRKELFDYIVANHLDDYGYLLDYESLHDILGKDPQENGRTDILIVSDWLLEDFGINLTCKVGQGYFIALQEDSRHLGNKREKRSSKELTKSLRIFKHSKIDQLSRDERESFDRDAHRVAIKYLITRKIEQTKTVENMEPIKVPSGKELIEIYKKRP